MNAARHTTRHTKVLDGDIPDKAERGNEGPAATFDVHIQRVAITIESSTIRNIVKVAHRIGDRDIVHENGIHFTAIGILHQIAESQKVLIIGDDVKGLIAIIIVL